MSKKLEGKSKLEKFAKSGQPQETLGLIANKKKLTPKSFRLMDSDIADLKTIQNAVNGISNTSVSETKIIQALIYIGKHTNEEKILKAVKEIIY